MRLSRAVRLLATLALLLAACGSGDDAGGDDADTADDPGTASTATSILEDPSDDNDPPTTTVAGDASSAVGGDFCDDVEASIAMDEDAGPTEQNVARAISEFDDLRSRAPENISAEVNALYEGLILIDDVLSGYGYNVTAVPENEMQRLDDAIQHADQRLREYCIFN